MVRDVEPGGHGEQQDDRDRGEEFLLGTVSSILSGMGSTGRRCSTVQAALSSPASSTYRKVGRWQEPRCGLRSAIGPHHCTAHPGAALDDVAAPVSRGAFFSPHLLRCGQKSRVAGTKALLRHVLPTSAAGNGAQGRAILLETPSSRLGDTSLLFFKKVYPI